MDKLIKALKRVVEDWGIIEIILFAIFVPWSFFYLGLRIVQEFDKEDDE